MTRVFKMGVTYLRSKNQLLLFNRGASLERANLLLGSTTKEGDDTQRGKYGEGFKVGSLALVRAKKPVTIFNGNEKWESCIKKSEEFDSEVLAFKITKNNPHPADKLLFQVDNITPDEWKSMNDVFLNIYCPPKETLMSTPEGDVLLDKTLKGKIYCGGIFVTEEKELAYGYNFKPAVLSLHRDRNMVNSFDVHWNTSKMWGFLSANKKGKLYDIKNMLKLGTPDVEYLSKFSDYTLTGKLAMDFLADNAERSYPVTSEEEAKRVRQLGYSPVYHSGSYTSTLRGSLGTIENLERRVELDYNLFQNITATDDANIQWVFEVMFKVDPKFKFKMVVAKFALDTTRSISDKKDLVLNSNLLKSKYEILHEAIQHYSILENKRESHIWKKVYKETVDGVKED